MSTPKRFVSQEEVVRRLRDTAHAIQERLPEGYGFICLTFPFSGADVSTDMERVNYVSNAKRADAVNALKEWLIKASGPEEWMKHL